MITKLLCIFGGSLFLFLLYRKMERIPQLAPFIPHVMIGLPLILFIFSVVTLSCNVPFWDDYDAILAYLSQSFPERLSSIFDFHNEHRIFFPRLIFEGVYAMCGQFNFQLCMYLGDCILLAYLFLWGVQFRKQGNLISLFPAVWLFLDLANYENTIWALTAIQSHSVLFFGFVSLLLFEKRECMICYFASLLSAFLCTFSSGAGVFIWFCMAGMALNRFLLEDQHFHFKKLLDRKKEMSFLFSWKMVVFLCVAMGSLLFYFSGFFHAKTSSEAGFSLLLAVDFFVSFLGNIIPFHSIAFAIGIVVSILLAFVFYNWSKIQSQAVLFFLLFTLASILSGTLFRSSAGGGSAIVFRYRVISISIVCSLLFLIPQVLPKNWKSYWRRVNTFFLFPVIGLNLAILFFGYPLQMDRKNQMIHNISQWPEECQLRYPDQNQASEILKKAIRKGVYTPPQYRKDD